MKRIKVCHVVSGLKSGGVESMIFNYCSHLDSNKYEFSILYQHEPSLKNVNEFTKLGFKLIRIPSKVKHPLKNYKATYKYLKENKIDIVHCHMTLMNVIPLFAARKLRIKIRICHSHNSDVRKKNIVINFLENLLKKLCIKNATVLVACGVDAGKYMYGNLPFVVLNNALDLEKFKFKKDVRCKIREKYNIVDNDIVLGHIGRFTKQKNHDFIIELFKNISDMNNCYKLMIIGDGENKNNIMNKVTALKLNDKVIFTGIVPNINDFYNAFDIFILPSLWEGLPVAGIEAQASGLNCLFSNNIDTNVVLDKIKVKLLNLEEEEWKKQIIKISKSNYLERNINLDVFKHCNYDINTEVKKMEEIYELGE